MKSRKIKKLRALFICIVSFIIVFIILHLFLSKSKDNHISTTCEANTENIKASDEIDDNGNTNHNEYNSDNDLPITEIVIPTLPEQDNQSNSHDSKISENTNESIDIDEDNINDNNISKAETDDSSNNDDLNTNENGDGNEYDYSKPIPESEAVEDEFFSDAVFIGNSQVEGISIYSGMKDATVYAGKGIMVDTIYTKEIIKTKDSERITIMNALSKNKFKKVYILLGANELGWSFDYLFIEQYEKIIDDIKKSQPDATIYVNLIIPVSKEKDSNDTIYNNTNVNKFNKLIIKMCTDKKIYYINSKEALANEDGCLPDDAGHDGIHLNRDYYAKWFDYLKKHTIK